MNKLVIYVIDSHTHTHTHTPLTFEQIYLFRNATDCRIKLFCSHCIRFCYAKSSTRRKKLIMFSKDMAVVIHNHASLPYHTLFIQLSQLFFSFTNNLAIHIHQFIQDIFTFTFKPPNLVGMNS